MRRSAILPGLVAALACACETGDVREPATGVRDSTAEGSTLVPTRAIEAVQEAHTPAWMAIPGVTGTFVGATEDGRPCIKIMVERRTADLERRLPREVEGYPVEIVESGVIRPLDGGR